MGFDRLEQAKEEILSIKGDEKIADILSILEMHDFSSLLHDTNETTVHVAENIDEFFDELINNPVAQIGIGTGFKHWDASIGGGLRKGTLNVIGARMKIGKSQILQNMAKYISHNLKLPILYLDTEMILADHRFRLYANMSGVSVNDIETGAFGKNVSDKNAVLKAKQESKQYPYYYQNISGLPFEEHLSIMRRWITKYVGFHDDGSAKDCVI
jgi:replicative DNA helicase